MKLLSVSFSEIFNIFIVFALTLATVLATELTFELPDNAKECFHEILKKGVKTTLEFQVSFIF